MTAKDTTQYTMLIRVSEFGDTYRDRFAHSGVARDQFAAVADAVTQLRQHAVAKMSAAQQGKSSKATARRALAEQIGAVHRTARAVALTTPGLDDAFHLPHPRTEQALLTAGRMFARNAEAFVGPFVTHGLPPTFIVDLRATVEQFERAIRDRRAEQSGHAAARGSIQATLAAGLTAARVLDAIVANELRQDPVTLAVWQRARRIVHPRGGRTVSAPPAAVPAPVDAVASVPVRA
jgi:hypothetical protein